MRVAQQLAEDVGLVAACDAMQISRASVYRSRMPAADRGMPATHPRALTDPERSAVLETLSSKRFIDCAPAAVYSMLLEEDRYLCSVRTMYRVLGAEKAVRERRAQRRHPQYTPPQLLATGPNQVWSWDITKLLGVRKWEYFHLYVMLDIYSRYVVGWLVAEHESGSLAKHLIATCYKRQGIVAGQLTIHSDRGPAMMAKPVVGLLTTLDVHKTVSRPHVSNDNPFSEAQFKTMKYRPAFPRRFGSIQDARATLAPFFQWYNQHRHSGVGYLTPDAVHSGLVEAIQTKRASTLDIAYMRHPERFVRGRPVPPEVPNAVWINPPKESSVAAAGGLAGTEGGGVAGTEGLEVAAAGGVAGTEGLEAVAASGVASTEEGPGGVACLACSVPQLRHLDAGCQGVEWRSRARSGELASEPLRATPRPGTDLHQSAGKGGIEAIAMPEEEVSSSRKNQ